MARNERRVLRAAVYTRKSSEEGLDQAFNSLDAQRDACAAYIKSQGWSAVEERFDDGGRSGGTLDRPALQRLLHRVEERRVDVIVIYKIDRLTRSLADFARLAEMLDGSDVSFVSVTQLFNTTTSMGRLTLNMLLSFAQFEREVTGERIRDKIAASKRKGMWMGGFVPLGYDAVDRQLVINPHEADTVRTIYRLYRELGTVRQVNAEVQRLGLITKQRSSPNGINGGTPFSRGHLYRILSNPIYAGLIAHRDQVYPGRHDAIIAREDWEAAQQRLADNRNGEPKGRATKPSPLTSLLRDEDGTRFTPSHANKAGRRYRYYVEMPDGGEDRRERPLWRIPAKEIETAVREAMLDLLRSEGRLTNALDVVRDRPAEQIRRLLRQARLRAKELGSLSPVAAVSWIRPCLAGVTIGANTLRLEVRRGVFECWLRGEKRDLLPDTTRSGRTFVHDVDARIRMRGQQMKLVLEDQRSNEPSVDQILIDLIVLAHVLRRQLLGPGHATIHEIADRQGLTTSYVARIVRLSFLAPDITTALLEGRQPPDLTAERLRRLDTLPLDWHEQRRALGMDRA